MLSALPLLAALAACGPSPEDLYPGELPERVDFNFHVKPILSDRCFACHGPDEGARKAELRLDTKEGAMAVIRPGSARRSELFRRIVARDPEEAMPPRSSHLTLSDYERALIGRWIQQGAEWKPHWSLIAPEKPVPPRVSDRRWPANEIDRFVLARLEREGLTPSPEASRERLIRRVTYDLTGLPPTLQEIDAFLADRSPRAYERVVDRLLASPAYGERMASEWLDLARYADSHGYQDDGARFMWQWRDWVIDAFNRNQRYDEFVTWQMAGDLLPRPTREQILATGFLRNHPQSAEGGIVDEEFRVEYVSDRVTTLGRGLLGLSTDCARCHTHKYDPITQTEYFRLFAFFNSVDETGLGGIDGNNGPVLLLPDDPTERKLAGVRARLAEQEAALRRYRAAVAARPAAALPDLGADVERGLIGHFPLDTVTGEGVRNRVDPGHPGRVRGEPGIVPGRVGRAVEIRESALVEVEEAYAFDRSDPFSFSLWIYPTEARPRSPLLNRAADDNAGFNRGYELSLVHDTLFAALMHLRAEDAVRVQARTAVPMNRWSHLAMTYDGSSRAAGLRLYLNGRPVPVQVLSDHLRRTIVPGNARLQIGGRERCCDPGRFRDGRLDELRIYDRALTPLEVARLAGLDPLAPLRAADPAAWSAEQRGAVAAHLAETRDAELGRLARAARGTRAEETELLRGVPDVMVMRDRGSPRPTYLLARGAYDAPTTRVEPGTPESVLPFPDSLPRNRLGLSRWLFDARNPLTARVTVNRHWQMLFGTGLVKTSDDFGSQGEIPTHPELLDWLAVTYRESGWDTKALLKRMVMSSTYRQAAQITPKLRERDPENRLLARGPSHRLPIEMIRDGALAASGLLVHRVGGPSVKPYQPAGLWEEKAVRSSLMRYEQDHGESLYRRTLYTFWKRSSPPPLQVGFDAGERNVCTVRRPRTNTPPQALGLLNDPQFVEAARLLAERMVREGGAGADERLRFGFRAATARTPSARELAVLRSLLDRELAHYASRRSGALRLLATGERPRDPALAAPEVAAYTVVANAILNTDEFVTKR